MNSIHFYWFEKLFYYIFKKITLYLTVLCYCRSLVAVSRTRLINLWLHKLASNAAVNSWRGHIRATSGAPATVPRRWSRPRGATEKHVNMNNIRTTT